VLAEGIGRALGGDMHTPFAIDVDGQTITVFDPVNHVPATPIGASTSVVTAAANDRRWETIRRPVVVVGGELTLEMLDLTFNPIAKFYEAPIQMKATAACSSSTTSGAAHSAARSAEPVDRAAREPRRLPDAAHGPQVRVPFNVFIIFATNLKPEIARRRSVPAPDPVQDPREEPDDGGIRADLRDELPPARPRRSTR
jgi:hypothetical protein